MSETTRYRVDYDEDAQFEECNGEARPLTEEEYAENSYMREGEPIPYAEYLAYYGNPARHVYLFVERQDKCPCCGSWVKGDALYGIDFMDDQPYDIGTFRLEQLTGYLQEVAKELEVTEFSKAAE